MGGSVALSPPGSSLKLLPEGMGFAVKKVA